MDVNALKDKGNKAFAAKDYDAAIQFFSDAIAIDSSNHVLYSNRSAAKAGKRDWTGALEDAEACIKANPTWSKGYARKGAALHGAHKWDDAVAAYQAGLKLEDSPALRKGLKEVEEARESSESGFGSGGGGSGGGGFGQIFSDPGLLGKLAANPRTSKYLSDPAFMQKLQMIQRNPQFADSAMQDPRMIEVMGVAMGIDISAMSRPEGSDEMPPGTDFGGDVKSPPQSKPSPPPASQQKSQPTPSSSSTPKPPPPSATEDVEMAEDNGADADAKRKALKHKEAGSELYKKREFEQAGKEFNEAWTAWPKDMTFLTNLAACQYELGQYDECIATCEKAVDEGRDIRADYKLIAKAFGRIGSAYSAKKDYPNAIKYLNKSLTEHRTPAILNKLREVEKIKADEERLAYIDPALSEKAREEGNALFKKGDFVGAVKAYEESIKRDPKDPRGYNNRALCYTKLAALPEALKDAEHAIELDRKFVKAYLRKSAVLLAMREYVKALEAAQEAAEVDDEQKHTSEISNAIIKANEALSQQRSTESEEETLQRAMRDPEVASIMNDPVMQQILQQAQQNPGALQDHLKNPVVKKKIEKLISAGIIRTR